MISNNENYNFVWFGRKIKYPIITIREAGIEFNEACSEIMGHPSRVAIGFDSNNKVIAIKPSTDQKNTFVFNKRNNIIRIGHRALIKMLTLETGIKFDKSKKYDAFWKNDMLIVQLS